MNGSKTNAAEPSVQYRWHQTLAARWSRVRFGVNRRMQPTHHSHAHVDLTPMVDVTFLLLVFFMVTASFTLIKTLQQPTPSSPEPSVVEKVQEPIDRVVIQIDRFDVFTVFFGDWQAEAPSEQELYVKLREAVKGRSRFSVPLLIEADGQSSHERVVQALDAGVEVGLVDPHITLVELGI